MNAPIKTEDEARLN